MGSGLWTFGTVLTFLLFIRRRIVEHGWIRCARYSPNVLRAWSLSPSSHRKCQVRGVKRGSVHLPSCTFYAILDPLVSPSQSIAGSARLRWRLRGDAGARVHTHTAFTLLCGSACTRNLGPDGPTSITCLLAGLGVDNWRGFALAIPTALQKAMYYY